MVPYIIILFIILFLTEVLAGLSWESERKKEEREDEEFRKATKCLR